MPDESWLDDAPYLGGEPREVIDELIQDQGLPPPEEWDAYDVFIGPDRQEMLITAEGFEYRVDMVGSDVYDLDNWDWMWDIWEWLIENYPDVDRDSHYE